MYPLFNLIIVAILSTLAMTAFSYLVSFIFKKNFKEPELLNILIMRLGIKIPNDNREYYFGWLLHFIIGVAFVGIFKILLLYFEIDLKINTGLLFGFVSGLTGVVFWHLFFSFHPDPPRINKIMYYTQLVLAHMIFGLVMVLSLKSF